MVTLYIMYIIIPYQSSCRFDLHIPYFQLFSLLFYHCISFPECHHLPHSFCSCDYRGLFSGTLNICSHSFQGSQELLSSGSSRRVIHYALFSELYKWLCFSSRQLLLQLPKVNAPAFNLRATQRSLGIPRIFIGGLKHITRKLLQDFFLL